MLKFYLNICFIHILHLDFCKYFVCVAWCGAMSFKMRPKRIMNTVWPFYITLMCLFIQSEVESLSSTSLYCLFIRCLLSFLPTSFFLFLAFSFPDFLFLRQSKLCHLIPLHYLWSYRRNSFVCWDGIFFKRCDIFPAPNFKIFCIICHRGSIWTSLLISVGTVVKFIMNFVLIKPHWNWTLQKLLELLPWIEPYSLCSKPYKLIKIFTLCVANWRLYLILLH